ALADYSRSLASSEREGSARSGGQVEGMRFHLRLVRPPPRPRPRRPARRPPPQRLPRPERHLPRARPSQVPCRRSRLRRVVLRTRPERPDAYSVLASPERRTGTKRSLFASAVRSPSPERLTARSRR